MFLFYFLLLFFYIFTLWWGPPVGRVPVHVHMLHMLNLALTVLAQILNNMSLTIFNKL